MRLFGILTVQIIVVHLPMVIVTLGGIVLIATRSQVLRQSAGLAITGCSLLFAGTIATLAWTIGMPELIGRGYSPMDLGMMAFTVGVLLSLVSAAGVALLVAALLIGTRQPSTRQPATPAEELMR